jgi:hypothetical protein
MTKIAVPRSVQQQMAKKTRFENEFLRKSEFEVLILRLQHRKLEKLPGSIS